MTGLDVIHHLTRGKVEERKKRGKRRWGESWRQREVEGAEIERPSGEEEEQRGMD